MTFSAANHFVHFSPYPIWPMAYVGEGCKMMISLCCCVLSQQFTSHCSKGEVCSLATQHILCKIHKKKRRKSVVTLKCDIKKYCWGCLSLSSTMMWFAHSGSPESPNMFLQFHSTSSIHIIVYNN